MNCSLAEILPFFPEGKRIGEGRWLCRCPGPNHSNGDCKPSLSIFSKSSGSCYLHCFCGCRLGDILRRAGWKPTTMSEAPQQRRIVATYDYTTETGILGYQVLRTEPKGFWQRRPHPHDRTALVYGLTEGWYAPVDPQRKKWRPSTPGTSQAMELPGCPALLYRLPDIFLHPEAPVVIVEGEKDCETLSALQFVATTNSGGVAGWEPALAQYLTQRRVFILPDRDEAGIEWGRQVAGSLISSGCPSVGLWPELAAYPSGAKDISEVMDTACRDWSPSAKRQAVIELVRRIVPYRRG